MARVAEKLGMGPQLLTAFLLLGLAVSTVENSYSELSDDESIPDVPRRSAYTVNENHHLRRSPVELIRSSSGELPFAENQKRPYYDPQIFLLLGMDDIQNDTATSSAPSSSSEFELNALENALEPDAKTIEMTSINQSLMAKSVASLCLAIVFLLIYNGLFLHLLY